MSEEIKLPASSYGELIKIIQAYGNARKETTLDELSKLCGTDKFTISRNSGFLLELGIIQEDGRQKVITEKGKELARALQFNRTDEISSIWKSMCSENEFLYKMITAIKIRNGMDHQGFQSHISYSSGQKNTNFVKVGSNTVIDIFKIANLIHEVDGKLVTKEDFNEVTTDSNSKDNLEVTSGQEKVGQMKSAELQPMSMSIVSESTGIRINIDVNVSVNFNELDTLGEKLKKVIQDLKAVDTE